MSEHLCYRQLDVQDRQTVVQKGGAGNSSDGRRGWEEPRTGALDPVKNESDVVFLTLGFHTPTPQNTTNALMEEGEQWGEVWVRLPGAQPAGLASVTMVQSNSSCLCSFTISEGEVWKLVKVVLPSRHKCKRCYLARGITDSQLLKCSDLQQSCCFTALFICPWHSRTSLLLVPAWWWRCRMRWTLGGGLQVCISGSIAALVGRNGLGFLN